MITKIRAMARFISTPSMKDIIIKHFKLKLRCITSKKLTGRSKIK